MLDPQSMDPCFIISPFGIATESLPGGTHFITKNIKFAPFSDEHKARLVEYFDIIREESICRLVRGRPAFFVAPSELGKNRPPNDDGASGDLALKIHQFSIEYICNKEIPMLSVYFDGKTIKYHNIIEKDLRFKEENSSVIESSIWNKHQTYLEFLYKNIDKASSVSVALGRLCRARRQGPTHDGIIDLAIGLESLIEASTEIKFQFSLFHSLIYGDSFSDRRETFTKLQNLYDARSIVVHGGKISKQNQNKINKSFEDWNDLLKIAGANLTYYTLFCQNEDAKKWGEHVRSLALGLPRISTGGEAG